MRFYLREVARGVVPGLDAATLNPSAARIVSHRVEGRESDGPRLEAQTCVKESVGVASSSDPKDHARTRGGSWREEGRGSCRGGGQAGPPRPEPRTN